MKNYKIAMVLAGVICISAFGVEFAHSQAKAASGTVQVHMVITDESLSDNGEIAPLSPENVQVKQGKNILKVDQVIPAKGDNAALQLVILIDDTCDTGIGNNLTDLKDFISAQPSSTAVAVAYMSNATVQFTQSFTNDHALAAKAVRLPRGALSSMDSPYQSLIGLVKGWPVQKVRREVLMITDGIDRLRGDRAGRNPAPMPSPSSMPSSLSATTVPTISIDAGPASTASQRAGVIVHSIYATGIGRLGRNSWEAQLGQGGIGKIASETGGEYFALGTQNAVSFKPYLDRLQKILDNQYFLVFQANPGKKSNLQRVSIATNAPNVEIASADNVWVPSGS
jgi:hypothetical protein